MFGDFLALSMDSLINQATKYWFLTGERTSCPLVIRSVVGAGGRFGAIHSQMPVSWLMGIPGLKIVAPVDAGRREGPAEGGDPRRQPGDLLRAQAPLLDQGRGRRRRAEPLGRAAVVREGGDVTLVSAMKGVHDCLEAADAARRAGRLGRGDRPAHAPAARPRDGARARSRRRTASRSSRRGR